MGHTICISNQKGGVGKTSLTHNVGCVIAKETDKKVLFVDVDGQSNLTTAFGFDPDEVDDSMYKILTGSGSINLKKYIKKTKIENVNLIPSSQKTFSVEKELFDHPARQFVLADQLEKVKDDYDYIFIDTPPNLGIITLNALIACNAVILVYTASEFALDGLSQLLANIEEIQSNKRLNINDTKVIGAIQNRFKKATTIVNAELLKSLDGVTIIPKYFSPVSDTTEIEKAQFSHEPIIEYNQTHKATNDFKLFAKELMNCLD